MVHLDLRAREALFYGQHARLLRLEIPGDPVVIAPDWGRRAQAVRFAAERLVAHEALGEDFRIDLTVLADQAGIDSQALMGRLMVAAVVRPDGSLRHFSGHVTHFTLLGSEGGVATCQVQLSPWSHWLGLRVNNRLFLGQSLREQTEELLHEHQAQGLPIRWSWRVRGADPVRTMSIQGAGQGESDWNYLRRHWEAQGLVSWWEHDAGGHTLIVADDSPTQCPAVDGDECVPFQAAGGPDEEDAIGRWQRQHRLQPGRWAASAFDFKRAQPRHASTSAQSPPARDLPRTEVHEYAGAYGFAKEDSAGQARVWLRQQQSQARVHTFQGAGNSARIQAGRWFRLSGHFEAARGESPRSPHLVLSAIHRASNNHLQAPSGQGLPGAVPAQGEYTNEFTALALDTPWRPRQGLASTPVHVHSPQSATVAGPEGMGSLHTDVHGRIQVQFHWDRQQRRSTWVRVALPWAGGQSGALTLPRVGSEVIVQHLGGQPDRPVVTGVVHNAARRPPWQLPEQKSLSGIRSRELLGDGGNSPGGAATTWCWTTRPAAFRCSSGATTRPAS